MNFWTQNFLSFFSGKFQKMISKFHVFFLFFWSFLTFQTQKCSCFSRKVLKWISKCQESVWQKCTLPFFLSRTAQYAVILPRSVPCRSPLCCCRCFPASLYQFKHWNHKPILLCQIPKRQSDRTEIMWELFFFFLSTDFQIKTERCSVSC